MGGSFVRRPGVSAVVAGVLLGAVAVAAATDPREASEAMKENRLRKDGRMLEWWMIGPFPSRKLAVPDTGGVSRSGYGHDYLAALGGEARAVITSSTRLRSTAGEVQAGTPDKIFGNGLVIHRPFDNAVGYAFSSVVAGEAQDAYFFLSCDGSPQVWLNGERIVAGWRDHHKATPFEYGVRTKVRAGENRILVKIDNARGWWGFNAHLIPADSYAASATKLLGNMSYKHRGLTIKDVESADGALKLKIGFTPEMLDLSLPLDVQAAVPGGTGLFCGTAKTGVSFAIPGIRPETGLVTLRLRVAGIAGPPWRATLFQPLGAFGKVQAMAGSRIEKAMSSAIASYPAPWREATGAVLPWLQQWCRTEIEAPDHNDHWNLWYALRMAGELEKGRNMLAADRGRQYPVSFTWTDREGKEHRDEYGIQFPTDYGAKPAPALIFLRGSNVKKWVMRVDLRRQDWFRDMEEPIANHEDRFGLVRIDPITKNGFTPAMLDAMLVDVLRRFQVDPDRIYLSGISGGGGAAWNWACHSPGNFAAFAPQWGSANAVMATRLVHVPVWGAGSEKNFTVPPIAQEPALAALRAAGGTVKYTCHTNGAVEATTRADGALYKWFLEHRRTGKPVPPNPLDAIPEGLGPPAMTRLAGRDVILTKLRTNALEKRTNTDQRLLYDRYRRGGRLADRPLEYYLPIDADGTARDTGQLMVLPAPDGVKSDHGEPACTLYCATYRGDAEGISDAVKKLCRRAREQGHMPADVCRIVCLSGRLKLEKDGGRVLELQVELKTEGSGKP